jgi:uncharacterized protein
MREGSAKSAARKSTDAAKAGGATSALARFLEHPERPPGTLRYHELQGFLFAVATSPELVRPSEWMPIVFGGQEAEYADLEEARTMLAALMGMYNEVNASVRSERPALPPDCRFRKDTGANFAEDAPVSRWSRGFMRGYQWLEADWDGCVPDEYDHDFAALLMTLSFFGSEALAASYLKEIGREDLQAAAVRFRRVFPDALAEFARIGRLIQDVLLKRAASAGPSSVRPKVGRNEPCPCGSGRKYKKCCGSVA